MTIVKGNYLYNLSMFLYVNNITDSVLSAQVFSHYHNSKFWKPCMKRSATLSCILVLFLLLFLYPFFFWHCAAGIINMNPV